MAVFKKNTCLQLNYTLFACLDFWHRLASIKVYQLCFLSCGRECDKDIMILRSMFICQYYLMRINGNLLKVDGVIVKVLFIVVFLYF